MSSSAGSAANRLARESSPYLRLHAHNPVDWYPWGAEAIAKARAEKKPIFLSVGYSTCYWCHVMERESFSDPAVAAEMNRLFVNVKVDREERPDLDEVYMLATQILSGQGGWPNSLFLTPELEPFFAGTYFPPQDAHGRPGFTTVLRSIDHAWRERSGEVHEQARELSEAIGRHLEEIEPWRGGLPGRELAQKALAGLRQRFDATWGGFGQQPKFPTPSNLWLLFELSGEPRLGRAAGGVPGVRPEGAVSSDQPAMMRRTTLDQMARGGLFDQLAGGFHRYATDREWKVPHFEKMLYDNGLLLELYGREFALTGDAEAKRIALETAGWLEREMTAPGGAFWSALDAETDGHEGAYYVWTRRELDAALGREDAEFAAPLLGFADEPFFEGDRYVLHLPRALDVQARERRTTRADLLAELAPLRARLLEARTRRKRPATDDKILADWNGTAIAGLAVAGRALGANELTARAARAAEFVLGELRTPDGVLLHAWRDGEGRIAAFLSDYVFFVRGLLRLHQASGDARWLNEAVRLQAEQSRRLASPKGGYFGAAEADDLLFRSKELFDGAMPAANGVAALNLLELHAATDDESYLRDAEATLRAFAPIVQTHPDGARTMTIAFARFASVTGAAPREVSEDEAKAFMEGKDEAKPFDADARAALAAFAEVPTVRLDAAGEGAVEFLVSFRIKEGWHLAVSDGSPALGVAGAEVLEVAWPEASVVERLPGGEELRGFVGAVEIRGRLRREGEEVHLSLRFEACGEGRCRPAAEIELGKL
jgi:uncharacterized protein YyaL (SSP411 family)